MRTLPAILLLAGCAHLQNMVGIDAYPDDARDLTASERDVLACTVAAWEAREDLPALGELCERKMRDVQIVVASEQRFRELCGKCGPREDPDTDCLDDGLRGHGTSCLREKCWGKHSVRSRCYARPVIVVPDYVDAHAKIGSEAAHILANCAPGYEGDHATANPHYHADDRIWGAGGVARSCRE